MLAKSIVLMVLVLLIATPFGYWRVKTRRYSLAWFLSVHLPIPPIYLMRKEMGLSLVYVPIITIFLILGHALGARLHRFLVNGPGSATSACLFMDALRSVLKRDHC